DATVEPRREVGVDRATRWEALPARDHLLELGVARERIEDLLEADAGRKSNSCSHDEGTIWNGCSDVKMTPFLRACVRSLACGQALGLPRGVRAARAAVAGGRVRDARGAELPDLSRRRRVALQHPAHARPPNERDVDREH